MMSGDWKKIILHVDMDAFFASVEQLLHPEWRGKPVIVGADPRGGKGRGVVSAASYEARKYGVHSAMPIGQAYRRCPNGVYAPPHGHVYQEYSKKVFAVLDRFSPLIEPLSIDEAFMDMTGSLHLFGDLEILGNRLKAEIRETTGLNASVGIAPSKSVAKIASDFCKPDGLLIVQPAKVQQFLNPLPVTRLWGIGKKMCDELNKIGIRTVSQLVEYPLDVLKQKFGKMGEHIYRMARGDDPRDVVAVEDAKSVSNEVTFDTDQTDFEVIRNTVFYLSEKVAGRLRRAAIRGHTVHLKIRFEDFKTFTRSHSQKDPVNLTKDIFRIAEYLLSEFNPPEYAVRLLGVGVSNLEKEQGTQLSLWDAEDQKKLKLEQAMDSIQDKFGKDAIRHAQSLEGRKPVDLPRDEK